jgi:hypothetical protein
MPIRKRRKKLADGTDRTYTYQEMPDGSYHQLSTRDSSDSGSGLLPAYRSAKKNRIVAALLANSSLLVIGEPGSGKSFLAELVKEDLETRGFRMAAPSLGTVKQVLLDIASQLGVEPETLEGRAMNVQQLQEAIADWLSRNTAFLILDDAHRFPTSLRCWLEKLHSQEQPMLLLATYPPARDIFIKLPRLELEPLPDRAIREIMEDEAVNLDIELTPGQLADLQQRTGGNPMLARRTVREEYLGLEGHALDHTHWIDGTPLLIAGLMCFTILRFLGLGFNNTSLYLLGGILTVAVGVVRLMIYSLPRQSGRLGQ